MNAGSVTVTLPDAGGRFMSLQVITEDHYVPEVSYAGAHTLTFAFDSDGLFQGGRARLDVVSRPAVIETQRNPGSQ